MATLFFSYSHADENLRDQLETHLAALKRQSVISSWHDRRITAGTNLGDSIDRHIDSADVVLLLVSPDFIASDYCYEREMVRAMERHRKGETRVIPVILRPCDWQSLPFGELLATPKDGKPITTWPNLDSAFLDVVTSIKQALGETDTSHKPALSRRIKPASEQTENTIQLPARSSNLRIAKKFTDLERDRFRHDGFEYIVKFFDNSLKELKARNPGIEYTFHRVDANRFTAAAYRDGEKICKGTASVAGGAFSRDGIEYAMTDEPRSGMNEAVMVKDDEQSLYFESLDMQMTGHKNQKLSFQGAAELFWELFIRPLQSW
jgi:TIR domain